MFLPISPSQSRTPRPAIHFFPTLRRLLLTALVWLFAALNLSTASAARTVTDDLNRTVSLTDDVRRVIIADIYPLASLVAMLVDSRSIVGMHPVSMAAARAGLLGKVRPEVLKADTSFMRGSEANIESIMTLAPDVVFVNASNKVLVKRLEAAGIPAVAVSATRGDYDVFATFSGWVQILRQVFGDAVDARAIEAEAGRIRALTAERTRGIKDADKRRVLFLVQYDARRMVTSGRRFFGQFWCEAAGCINVASGINAENAGAVINIEQVYAWNPDAVLITNFTKAVPADLESGALHDWSSVRAVQQKAVYKMPLGLYRSFTPSADSPLTLLWIAKTLYPSRFTDIDMTRETQDYYRSLFGVTLSQDEAAALFPTARNPH